jgi:hypothetical protein
MKKLALFVAHPYCSAQSNNGIVEALESKYTFKLFTKHEIEDNFFDDVDGVIFGGGFGDSESFHHLMRNNSKSVKKFVKSGGKYIGICMGGYWAGKSYFNLLQECDTVQYITRPHTDTRRPHAKNLDVIWNGSKEKMFFYDGFAVTEGNYLSYAKYMNGDSMAIIQNNIGIIGCHPEATQHWYDSYSWMHGKYVSKHNLLLEFVDKVMYDT